MGKPFEAGRTKTGGRQLGSRNRLSGDFLKALADEFEAHGADAIRICRVEDPATFVKIVASLMPKELEISDNRLKDVSDDELEFFISYARRQLESRVIIGNIEGGKETATDGGQARVLLPVPKAT